MTDKKTPARPEGERVSDGTLARYINDWQDCFDADGHIPEWLIAKELQSLRASHSASVDGINKLANFIMATVDGEPSKSEGAIDCAIRIITQYRQVLAKHKEDK